MNPSEAEDAAITNYLQGQKQLAQLSQIDREIEELRYQRDNTMAEMAVAAIMIQDGQEYGQAERSPGHPGHQDREAYDNQAIRLNHEDLLCLQNPLSQGDLTNYGHLGANPVNNFDHAVISDEAESDLQKFYQNTLDKAELIRFGIRSQNSPLSLINTQGDNLTDAQLRSNQEYEGGGATMQGSGGTGPSMAGGTIPVSGVSAAGSARDSNALQRQLREPRIIDQKSLNEEPKLCKIKYTMDEVQSYANDLISCNLHIFTQNRLPKSKCQDLMPSITKLAQAFLDSRLPKGWLAIRQDEENGQVFYLHDGKTTRSHPLDAYFKLFVARELQNCINQSKRLRRGLASDEAKPGLADLDARGIGASTRDQLRRKEEFQKQIDDPAAHRQGRLAAASHEPPNEGLRRGSPSRPNHSQAKYPASQEEPEQDGSDKQTLLLDQVYLKYLEKNPDAFSIHFTDEILVNHAVIHVKNSLENLEAQARRDAAKAIEDAQSALLSSHEISLANCKQEYSVKLMREERMKLDRVASKRESMRDQVDEDHQRNLDLTKFANAQNIANAKLQIESGSGIRDGLDESANGAERDHQEFIENLKSICDENVKEAKHQLREQLKQARQDMLAEKSSVIESRRKEIQDEREALIQKIKENLQLENHSKEERLREKRHDVQNQMRSRFQQEQLQIAEDFEMRRNQLRQEDVRKRENQKILMQSKKETEMVEGEIKLNKRANDPEARAQMFKKALDLHLGKQQEEFEREKNLITAEYAQKFKNEQRKIQKEIQELEPGTCVGYLKKRVLDLKEQMQQMQVKQFSNKFVTIGDIEEGYVEEMRQDLRQPKPQKFTNMAHQKRDVSVPKARLVAAPITRLDNSVPVSQRSPFKNDLRPLPGTPSERAITAKLDGISERRSSDLQSKISSGLGASNQGWGLQLHVLDAQKLKEIKQYTANEIYRCQKRSDEGYKEFEKVRTLRKDLLKSQSDQAISVSDNSGQISRKSYKELDIQYEHIRKKLKRIQEKYELLKKLRANLQKLKACMDNGFDPVQQSKLESQILHEYEYLREKTRNDAERAKKQTEETYSEISASVFSKGFSDITTGTAFEQFYSKWEGIIKSGKNVEYSGQYTTRIDPHFFDDNAWLKLPKDDENLKFIKKFQKGINDLRVNNPLQMPFGYEDAKRPKLAQFGARPKSANYNLLYKQYQSKTARGDAYEISKGGGLAAVGVTGLEKMHDAVYMRKRQLSMAKVNAF